MKRVLAATWVVIVACASPGIPPGGPPDKEAPALVSAAPDTGALNARQRSVLLRFDEVINERSTPLAGGGSTTFSSNAGGVGGGGFGGGGFATGGSGYGGAMGSSLSTMVVLSPGDGRERVTWRRTAIEIEPRNGFRPNTTYRLTLLPGLADLRGNVLRTPIEIVFSTGATRTSSTIRGAIFDWVAGRAMPGARIEVFTTTDSTLRWMARADSTGRFAVHDLAPGTYRLRGWSDANGNRVLDPRDLLDSTTVTVDTAASADLYTFVHDTLGPRIESLEPIDSTAVRIKFDRGVDVTWRPSDETIILMRTDSSVVPLRMLIAADAFDSLKAAARDSADAAKAAADTTKPPRDTTAANPTARPRPDSVVAPVPPPGAPPAGAPGGPPPRQAPRITIVREAGDTAKADTVKVPQAKMERPVPTQVWVVRFVDPLPTGEYHLKVQGVRGLNGRVSRSEREFRLRPPPPPRDTAEAARPRPKP